MYAARVILCTVLCKLAVSAGEPLHPLSDDFIDLLNKEGKWKAGRNFPADTPMEYFRNLMGTRMDYANLNKLRVKKHDSKVKENLPESFDPRDKWPKCPTLKEIRDQGQCGSCWAFGAVEVMSDRVCIYSNGTINFHFSAEDLVTCNSQGCGCDGGDPVKAWEEWIEVGLVSGGNYDSHQGCKSYSFAPCPNHMKNCTNFKPTPKCVESCDDGYKVSYEDDKKRGRDFYLIKGEEDIMAELYENGPVEAAFMVYEDFADYKGGVYEYVKGKVVFGHAVKMIGWGVEDGKKYWLVANCWGTGFGENGYFKILRGVDECGIESYIVGGEPLLDDF